MILELSQSHESYAHLTALEQRAWKHASNHLKPLRHNSVNYKFDAVLLLPLFFSGICFGIGITLAIIW